MKEAALIDQARDALLKCLQDVPFVKVEVMKKSKRLQTGVGGKKCIGQENAAV